MQAFEVLILCGEEMIVAAGTDQPSGLFIRQKQIAWGDEA